MEYEEFLKHNELNNLYADDILKFYDQEDKFQENTKLVYKFSADYFKDKREKESKTDGVNHPSHYTSGKVEVIDIIEELKDFNVNVDVYDPWVNNTEQSKWYKHGIIKNPLNGVNKYDAIIVAVAHTEFKAYTPYNYTQLSNGVKVIIDIKNIVENPTWRL